MGRIILPVLIAFSILLLVPVGVQDSFADHPDEFGCPDMLFLSDDVVRTGVLATESFGFVAQQDPFNHHFCFFPVGAGVGCADPYHEEDVLVDDLGDQATPACFAEPIPIPHISLEEQCQDSAVLVGNHCVPDLDAICGEGTMSSGLQCIALGMQAVGGMLVEINALAVLGAAVGVDPLITGLVMITMVGITGQAAWFVHRRKKKD